MPDYHYTDPLIGEGRGSYIVLSIIALAPQLRCPEGYGYPFLHFTLLITCLKVPIERYQALIQQGGLGRCFQPPESKDLRNLPLQDKR